MTYSQSYFSARESWRDWRIEARALIDLAHVTQRARVLEIGCGGGGLLRMLTERGARAVGVDTLDAALDLARTRKDSIHASEVANQRGEQAERRLTQLAPATTREEPGALHSLVKIDANDALPFCSDVFDAVVGQHVVEHVSDADAALREWRRVLRPGGRVALVTPNARYPDPAHFADADHVRVFTPTELCGAAERAGFVVESYRTIFPFLSRARALRAFGVTAYRVFQHAPYFASRGRTIVLCARKSVPGSGNGRNAP